MSSYSNEAPFDASLMVYFRERIDQDLVNKINQKMVKDFSKKAKNLSKKSEKRLFESCEETSSISKRKKGAIAKQLQYIKRNLSSVETLINLGADLSTLSPRKYKMLLVVTEVYRQQLWMYENESTRIDDRIVSINQPHK